MTNSEDTTDSPLNEQQIDALRGNVRALHTYLEDQAVQGVPRRAYSIDGRTFSYQAPISSPVPVGSYVSLQTTDDVRYLGQVLSKDVVQREGAELDIELDFEQQDLFPEGVNISGIKDQLEIPILEGTGVLLGRVTDDEVASVSPGDTFQNATVGLADADVVTRYLGGPGRNAQLEIGQALYVDSDVPVHLDAGGFNRHTFLCGQSGSGKTFSLGIVLEQLLLETDLRIVVIDPNSDFVNLNRPRTHEEMNRVRSIPLSSAEYDEMVERYRAATESVRVFRPESMATDDGDVLRVRFGDLSRHEQGGVLQLDPLEDREEFNAFWHVVDDLERNDYSWAEVTDSIAHDYTEEARQLGLRIENLGFSDWEVWSGPGEPSLIDAVAADDWRCLVLDVGTLSSSAEKSVVANALLTHLWREREHRRPTLVVVDEAHNVCPQQPGDELTAMSTDAIDRIAAEGRKFGLYLLLSTQRPGKIQDNVLSQCDNLVLMRMNSSSDLDYLATRFSQVPGTLLAEASTFGLGETVLGGRIVQNPTVAKFGGRLSVEGGSDVPATWARRRE